MMPDEPMVPGPHSDEPLVQMALDDHESTLRLMVELQDVINAGDLTPAARLQTISEAITRAIGGSVEDARDFVRDVLLGRLSPPA